MRISQAGSYRQGLACLDYLSRLGNFFSRVKVSSLSFFDGCPSQLFQFLQFGMYLSGIKQKIPHSKSPKKTNVAQPRTI